ncbi:pheromone A receptor-domain-containing protein [Crucibulum laeve]|uniref:Pheromone A receptor-domain-containing protein n=1 Tax=Crucibulum laeve TaxID=68775 RepID=A0A5C3LJL5_9AGAR|nr:pheromone A receptor-domain-containing protein [Crucibulum laeve]
MDPTYPLFPTLAFLGFILSIIPLTWHIRTWNLGTCVFMLWTGIGCLIFFVNSLIWGGNFENVVPAWCDISSKLIIGASVGIPASILCIIRRLYNIISIQTVSVTRNDKRKMIAADLCIALGIPMGIMILHVIVQDHRFDILEDIGCYPVVYNTLPAYFIYFMWPVLLGVISFVYSSLTLRAFCHHRLQLNQLVSSKSSLTMSLYLRLMILVMIGMVFTVPSGIFFIYAGNKGVGVVPWISWEETHYNFAHVSLNPAIFWRIDPALRTTVELTRWLPIFCACLFFGLFGFASEARKNYALAFFAVAKFCGYMPTAQNEKLIAGWNRPPKLSGLSIGSLPVYVPRTPTFSVDKNSGKTFSTGPFADIDDAELDTYIDIEKSSRLSPTSPAAFSAPPKYAHPEPVNIPADVTAHDLKFQFALSPPSSSNLTAVDHTLVHFKAKASSSSPRSIAYQDRVYVTNEHSPVRPPSPAPFSNVIPTYHRPITPPNTYSVIQPHLTAEQSSADIIQATVHTESRGAV